MTKIKSKKKSYILPIAIGTGIIAFLLLAAKESSAATNVLPLPGPIPPSPKPSPSPFPAGSALATVIPNQLGGINTRNEPSPDSSLIEENSAFNGTTVAVLETGILEKNAPPGSVMRWWKIMTPTGGIGYARAIGPQGENNFNPIGNIPIPAPKIAGYLPYYY